MKHRRIISLLSAALLGISAAAFPPAALEPVSIVAEAVNYGDWEYTVSGSNATITGYNGTSTTPQIPPEIKGKTVTKIGNYAFLPTVNGTMTPKNITSITIPDTVTEIGRYAFARTPLTSVTIPSSVLTIKDGAFKKCTSMTVLRVEGAANIDANAFSYCSSLRRVWMNKDCVPKSKTNGLYVENIFDSCTSLEYINGSSAWYLNQSTGEPVLTSNAYARNLIQRFFASSASVKFVDTYCTALCNYIVSKETKWWMGDAVKARQLNDWIVRHCEYEDFIENGLHYNEGNADLIGMNDNQYYSSVFLSYGLNLRGAGVGETVCKGFAKAYALLLRTAGIESYVIHSSVTTGPVGHAWNIVKIKNKYYQCDVCASDELDTGYDYITNYLHFLVSADRMDELQGYTANVRSIWDPASPSNGLNESRMFPGYNVQTGTAAMSQCNYNYSNQVLFLAYGLKNGDWNFDGTANTTDDTDILNLLHRFLPSVGYEYMGVFLRDLLQIGWSPKQWYDYYS